MERDCPFVSRGGLKLAAALDAFSIDPTGLTCADLGCSTGGFADCLLQRGAGRVYAMDTAYGALAWKLRQDARVTVLERTNALHFDPWTQIAGFTGCELVTVDLGWTRQVRALAAARRWLGGTAGVPGDRGHPPPAPPGGRGETAPPAGGTAGVAGVVTLVKPHYEAVGVGVRPRGWRGGRLEDAEGEQVTRRVLAELEQAGWRVAGRVASPVRGEKGGNLEHLAWLVPV